MLQAAFKKAEIEGKANEHLKSKKKKKNRTEEFKNMKKEKLLELT